MSDNNEADAPQDDDSRFGIGDAVRALRERRGLRQSELAGLARMAPAQLSALERGGRNPTLRTLGRLCDALGTTMDDLMRTAFENGASARAEPYDDSPEPMLPGMREFFPTPEEKLWSRLAERGIVRTVRVRGALPPEGAVDRMETLVSDYLRLETICGAFRRASIPLALPFAADADGAEQLAARVREALGLGDTIVHDYVSVFESHGVRVIFTAVPHGLDSFSFYDMRGNGAFIVVDENANPEKQLFRIASEVAWIYLFTRNGMNPVPESAEVNRRFAKYFAACFLLPRSALLSTAASLGVSRGDWSYRLVLRVKRHFGVSAESFCYRLNEVGLIGDRVLENFKAAINGFYEETAHREPGEALAPLVRNGRLADLVERAREIPGAWSEAAAIARHAGIADVN